MSKLERYQAYADAFEESFKDDDWSRIGQYFTEGAVYEGDPEARGREAVLAKLKNGVDNFDRKMDSRTPDFQTPTLDGDTLTMRWQVTYTKAGRPDLVISGVETAVFEGDSIALLRDTFDAEAQQRMEKWMAEHGAALAGCGESDWVGRDASDGRRAEQGEGSPFPVRTGSVSHG